MALVSMRQLLDHAAERGYGIPAFNVNNLEQIQAIMQAADETDSPVIMQGSAGARGYAGEPFLRHLFIAGNVEAELGEDSDAAGCGCAYPASVDSLVVERSNQIHATLKRTALRHSDLLVRLHELPMVSRYRVGGVRVGVVHGDAESLAGWRFDVAALDDPKEQSWRAEAFARAEVDVFTSTHTCLLATRCFDLDGEKVVANNGAAGMPNARGTRFGILTRIGIAASPHARLYGRTLRGVHVDALAIRYDDRAWQVCFLKNWPAGSAAWLSYFNRLVNGPDYRLGGAGNIAAG